MSGEQTERRVFIDTNILVYALTAGTDYWHAMARRLLEGVLMAQGRMCLRDWSRCGFAGPGGLGFGHRLGEETGGRSVSFERTSTPAKASRACGS